MVEIKLLEWLISSRGVVVDIELHHAVAMSLVAITPVTRYIRQPKRGYPGVTFGTYRGRTPAVRFKYVTLRV